MAGVRRNVAKISHAERDRLRNAMAPAESLPPIPAEKRS
jgi:hypothetical protein